MILTSMFINESVNLDFDISISGVSDYHEAARFVIEGPDFNIICNCYNLADDKIVVKVPILEGKLPPGVYTAKLELVIDGKIYTPLKESIEFRPAEEFSIFKNSSNPIVKKLLGESSEPKVVEAAKPKALSASAGTKPPQTWDQIVRGSITNPANAKPYKHTVKQYLSDDDESIESSNLSPKRKPAKANMPELPNFDLIGKRVSDEESKIAAEEEFISTVPKHTSKTNESSDEMFSKLKAYDAKRRSR